MFHVHKKNRESLLLRVTIGNRMRERNLEKQNINDLEVLIELQSIQQLIICMGKENILSSDDTQFSS